MGILGAVGCRRGLFQSGAGAQKRGSACADDLGRQHASSSGIIPALGSGIRVDGSGRSRRASVTSTTDLSADYRTHVGDMRAASAPFEDGQSIMMISLLRRFFLLAILVIALRGFAVSAQAAVGCINFTSIPPYGTSPGLLQGTVSCLEPLSDYSVAVYIRVGSGWWTKPYSEHPLTTIQPDGTWSAVTVTGGKDYNANAYAGLSSRRITCRLRCLISRNCPVSCTPTL